MLLSISNTLNHFNLINFVRRYFFPDSYQAEAGDEKRGKFEDFQKSATRKRKQLGNDGDETDGEEYKKGKYC